MNKQIKPSELIINRDGSIYHLHLRPEEIPGTIILVGDPGRVAEVSKHFSPVTLQKQNREYITHSGYYKQKNLMVISSGIGTGNIDIVLNELDALVNIDFKTRTILNETKSLNLVRLGTTGAIQPGIRPGTVLITYKAIGFDGLLNYYHRRNEISDLDFEKAFISFVEWNPLLPVPYVVDADPLLYSKLKGSHIPAVSISAPGFYGPQSRILRIPPQDKTLNDRIGMFEYHGLKITNFEMECSGIYGLSKLMNHKAVTLCTVIANRATQEFLNDYTKPVENMILTTLESLSTQPA
jgi:uridine phosphorylase